MLRPGKLYLRIEKEVALRDFIQSGVRIAFLLESWVIDKRLPF